MERTDRRGRDNPRETHRTSREVVDRMKYDVRLTKEQVAYAIPLAKKIVEKRKGQYNNRGGHARKNPLKSAFTGFLAETVFADIWGLERPEVKEDIDIGWDFKMNGHKYQVKGSMYTGDYQLNCIMPKNIFEKDFDSLVFIHLRRQEEEASHYPSLSKEEVKKMVKVKDFGYGDRYAIPAKQIEKGR